MAENTLISWADYTWSPWTACTRISPACDGCYAAHLMDTRMHRAEWGAPGAGEGTRSLMSESHWKKPLAWNAKAAKANSPRPPFVFPSLCDPFDNAVPQKWRRRFLKLIDDTPFLIWLLLTKRLGGNVSRLTDPERGELSLPRNVAIGGTFCNQQEWDRDGDKLESAKTSADAIFSFGSFEPLLSGIDFKGKPLPDWIIAGGETNQGEHKARPTHPNWVRDLRDQAIAGGKPFHFKQWGEWVPQLGSVSLPDNPEISRYQWAEWEEDHWEYWDRPMWCDELNEHHSMIRAGKKRSGRLLDGVEHNDFPKIERIA
jgi:protein gp37